VTAFRIACADGSLLVGQWPSRLGARSWGRAYIPGFWFVVECDEDGTPLPEWTSREEDLEIEQ
jgi:hypothetical protein